MWYNRLKPTSLFQTFSECEIPFSLLCHYFSEIFCTFHVAQMLLDSFQPFLKFNQSLTLEIHVSLRLSDGRFVFVLPCAYFSNKINYCSHLYRTHSLFFRLLSLLWDYGW